MCEDASLTATLGFHVTERRHRRAKQSEAPAVTHMNVFLHDAPACTHAAQVFLTRSSNRNWALGAVASRCAMSPADMHPPPPPRLQLVTDIQCFLMLCLMSSYVRTLSHDPSLSLLSVKRTSLLQVCLRWRVLHQKCKGERVCR